MIIIDSFGLRVRGVANAHEQIPQVTRKCDSPYHKEMGIMGTTPTAEVIEATGTSTPAQGEGNRATRRAANNATAKAKREAAKAAKEAEMIAAKLRAEANEMNGIENEDTVTVSKPAKAAFAIGRGFRRTGQVLVDTDLRDIGHGIRGLKRLVPVIHVEKRSKTEDLSEDTSDQE